MKDGIEGNVREGLFYLFFECSPHLIGLAVTDLETGELAFPGWDEHVDGSIENFQNIPSSNGRYWSCQGVTSSGPFFGFNNTLFSKSLKNLLEIVFGKMFGLSDRVDRERLFGLSQGQDCPEAVVGFFGDFHL